MRAIYRGLCKYVRFLFWIPCTESPPLNFELRPALLVNFHVAWYVTVYLTLKIENFPSALQVTQWVSWSGSEACHNVTKTYQWLSRQREKMKWWFRRLMPENSCGRFHPISSFFHFSLTCFFHSAPCCLAGPKLQILHKCTFHLHFQRMNIPHAAAIQSGAATQPAAKFRRCFCRARTHWLRW